MPDRLDRFDVCYNATFQRPVQGAVLGPEKSGHSGGNDDIYIHPLYKVCGYRKRCKVYISMVCTSGFGPKCFKGYCDE